MRVYPDTGIWVELSHDPVGTERLRNLVRRRRVQFLVSPTSLAELHGIGPGHQEIYDATDRTVRALAWDRIARDAQELVTLAFVRYAARLLGGEFATEASRIDGTFLLHDRLSQMRRFSYNAPLKQELDERKDRNLARARRLRQEVAADTDGALTGRVNLFTTSVQTPGAPVLLAKLRGLPANQKVCPFILSHRDGFADLDTMIAASDTTMLHTMVGDMRELPTLPRKPWDNPATLLLTKHAAKFTDDFWRGLHRVNDDPFLFRQRTMNFLHHYLLANGFARDNGSFWFDGQNVVYAHDVHLFATTDERTARGLRSDYMKRHLAAFVRNPMILHLPTGTDVAAELFRAIKLLT